jgi:hypothetical protein
LIDNLFPQLGKIRIEPKVESVVSTTDLDAQGGMSRIRVCTCCVPGQPPFTYVEKVTWPDNTNTSRFFGNLRLWAREACTGVRLCGHPTVARIWGVACPRAPLLADPTSIPDDDVQLVHSMRKLGEQFPIIMKYYERGSLRKLLKDGTRKPFTPLQIAVLVFDICFALYSLHVIRRIHCDVKPENLLLEHSDDGLFHAKLADFGGVHKVRDAENASNTTTNQMTKKYVVGSMACDIVWERDMTALGVVILELLAPPGVDITRKEYEELFNIAGRVPANAKWLDVCRQIIVMKYEDIPSSGELLREMIKTDGLIKDSANQQIFRRHAAGVLASWQTPLGDMFYSPRRSRLLSIVVVMSPEKAAAATERLGQFMTGSLTSKRLAYDDKG